MRVGFIGLGTMGSRMAANLQAAGHHLVIHDVNPIAGQPLLDGGATWAVSPAAVAGQVEALFTSLPGPAQVEAVALSENGIIGGALPGLAYFDLSTNSPTVMRHIHAELSPRGIHVFDAPVSGGPDGAASGRLAIWAGGDPDAFDYFLPLLRCFSDAPHLVGPIGAGSVAKLVHNASGYILQTALAETFTLGVKAGVEPEALWEAVRMGALGRRRTFDTMSRNFLPGRFDPPDFALELARKDVALACELGREYDVPMRLTNLTLMEMTEAMNRGWARRDSRSAMLLQEERTGVEVRIPAERIADIIGEESAASKAQAEPPEHDKGRSWLGRAVGRVRGKGGNAGPTAERRPPSVLDDPATSHSRALPALPATTGPDTTAPHAEMGGAEDARDDAGGPASHGTARAGADTANSDTANGHTTATPSTVVPGRDHVKPPSILDNGDPPAGESLTVDEWLVDPAPSGATPSDLATHIGGEATKPPSILDDLVGQDPGSGTPPISHSSPGPSPHGSTSSAPLGDANAPQAESAASWLPAEDWAGPGPAPSLNGRAHPPLDDQAQDATWIPDPDAAPAEPPSTLATAAVDPNSLPSFSPAATTGEITVPIPAMPLVAEWAVADPSGLAEQPAQPQPSSLHAELALSHEVAARRRAAEEAAAQYEAAARQAAMQQLAAHRLAVEQAAAEHEALAQQLAAHQQTLERALAEQAALFPLSTAAGLDKAARVDSAGDGAIDSPINGAPNGLAPSGLVAHTKGLFYGWTIVGTVFFILMVTSGLGFYNASVILKAAKDELGVSVGAASGATALFFGISGVTGFVLARRMEKVDLRWFYLAGGLIGSGALLSLRWVHNVWALYAFFFVYGIAFAVAGLVPGITLVTRWFHVRRSIAISIASTGLSVGGITLTRVASTLIDNHHLDGAGPIMAAIWFVGVIPIALIFIRSHPADKGVLPLGMTAEAAMGDKPAVTPALPGASFLTARATRFFIMTSVAYALIFFSQVGGLAHLYSTAAERSSKGTAADALSLLALTSVVGRLLGGFIVLRVPTRLFSMALVVLQALALISISVAHTRLAILASAVFLGISVGNLLMLQPLLLAESFGAFEISRIYAFNQLFSTIGVAGGPVALGIIRDHANYQTAFVVAAAASVLGFIAFSFTGGIDGVRAMWAEPTEPDPVAVSPALAPA